MINLKIDFEIEVYFYYHVFIFHQMLNHFDCFYIDCGVNGVGKIITMLDNLKDKQLRAKCYI